MAKLIIQNYEHEDLYVDFVGVFLKSNHTKENFLLEGWCMEVDESFPKALAMKFATTLACELDIEIEDLT